MDGIPNGVSRVRMEIKDISLFPHMLRCWFGGKTFTGLITVPGRAPTLQGSGACPGYVPAE